EPVLVVSLPSPRRGGRRRNLVGRMTIQVVARANRFDRVLVVVELAEEIAEKDRPLVPPVAEQLRIVRADDDGRAIHAARETFGLPLSGHPKVRRMLPS